MHVKTLLTLALITLAPVALAAKLPAYLTSDHSTQTLLDGAAAKAVWQAGLADEKQLRRLAKLNPPAKWAFHSQVEGGFTEAKVCVVTARAALLPRRGQQVVFAPAKMATTFDAKPNATQAECTELAKAKLGEAVKVVIGSLLAN